MLTGVGGAFAYGTDAVQTRRETEHDRAFFREQQRMLAMMNEGLGRQRSVHEQMALGDIYGYARIEHTTDNRVSFYTTQRPVATSCGGCGATQLEAHVMGWRCAYCGRDR